MELVGWGGGGKKNVELCDLHAVCVSANPLLLTSACLGYVMAPEPASTAHLKSLPSVTVAKARHSTMKPLGKQFQRQQYM
jgi:hypothetical protein